MDKESLLRVVLQRILAPSYLGTVLWIVTDYYALAIGGFAVSVLFALLYPFLEVSHEALLGYHLKRQGKRRAQLVGTFLPFVNAYARVLSKYPPALLPEVEEAVTAQIAVLAEHVRPLKERRLPQTADPYELVQAGVLAPRAFTFWRLADFQAWQQQVLDDLADGDIPTLQRAVEHFIHHPTGNTWQPWFTESEQDFDRQAVQTLQGWRCVQLAQQDPAIRQRLLTLLRLDVVHRQSGLHTYLAAQPLLCSPAESRAIMAVLRYESVATKLCELLEG